MELPVSANFQKLPLSPIQGPIKDSEHWNLIFKNHAKLKNDQAILYTYTQMEALGVSPDSSVLPLVLKACGRLKAIEKGRRIHGDICNTNMIDDVRIRTALVDFYCKCGFYEDARHLFDETSDRDVVLWNAMINGCVGCSRFQEAIGLFIGMQLENLRPNSVTVVALLSACGERHGKEMHGYCFRNGMFDSNPYVATALLGFYSKLDVRIAHRMFNLMVLRSTASSNVIISGYYDEGDYLKVLELFVHMIMDGVSCDSVTLLVVIQACTEFGSLKLGMQVHQLVIKFDFHKDLYIVNALVNMYGKKDDLESSLELFESTSTRDVALWNSLISVYVDNGSFEEALSLFIRMQFEGVQEDERTIVILLSSCANWDDGLRIVRCLHTFVTKNGMERNTSIGNALVCMYTQLNFVEEALKVFSMTSGSDVISWNSLILALARNKLTSQAWNFFGQMQESDIKPNSHTIISILAVCEDETSLNVGRSIHGYAIKHGIELNPSLNTALTEMYMNCGDGAAARNLFDTCTDKDLITWNALMASYIKNNQSHKTLLLFRHMISEVEPNSVTMINVLSSCTHLANLLQGKCLHAYTTRRESSLGFNLSLANAFITMYARCGSMQYAEKIFAMLPRKNIISWNALISGYGMHGRGYDAMFAFSQMLENGFKPNGITFVSALSACSHSGLVRKGLQLFSSMVQDFFLSPELVHYACVVDLLGRGGCLDEARKFIDLMPIEPDVSVWRALLGACRVFSDTKLAKTIFEKLIELEPSNAGNYILLSNIYAEAGLWSEVRNLRLLLKVKGLEKPPGKSWIVVRNQVHCFTAGDKSHPQSEMIYAKVGSLLPSIRETGYVPDLRWVLHDEDNDKKLKRLFSHSEKLAIAFGLINVSCGTPILITKNLRVCGDCHEFSKYISKFTGREIVFRDRSRYHHFINGLCSCKDYW